ncbi:hypothetical protein L2E82_48971 [Cichorium intybus]|uniref:Uncharacterized protein n=1 Tax=Cichorium intybus TaxID=13427 RepID=A0ACB8YYD7_CICIN|nr:hypothetical protein L2E82_48971 [Cichorium intybus]
MSYVLDEMGEEKGEVLEAVLKDTVDLESIPIEDVFENLRCTKEGLTSSAAQERVAIFGHYKLEEKKSALTGESLPVTKGPGDGVYSGSTCKQDEIEAIVIATGVHTFFGKAAHLVDTTNQVGHFQKVLTAIGNFCICSIAVGMLIEIIVFAKGVDADTVVLMSARASRTENQDAIDAAIVGMLADPKEILNLAHTKSDIECRVHAIVDKFADRGLRSLAVAYQDVPEGRKESQGGPWQFIGLMPIFDPPRHDSADTIRRTLDLGVNVKMITDMHHASGLKWHSTSEMASDLGNEGGSSRAKRTLLMKHETETKSNAYRLGLIAHLQAYEGKRDEQPDIMREAYRKSSENQSETENPTARAFLLCESGPQQ